MEAQGEQSTNAVRPQRRCSGRGASLDLPGIAEFGSPSTAVENYFNPTSSYTSRGCVFPLAVIGVNGLASMSSFTRS